MSKMSYCSQKEDADVSVLTFKAFWQTKNLQIPHAAIWGCHCGKLPSAALISAELVRLMLGQGMAFVPAVVSVC